jgi:transcriptional regulator
MYVPSHFDEQRPDVLHQAMHDHPLAMVVTLGAAGLDANHLPLEFDAAAGPNGTLRGHVSRANPMWRDASRDVDTLAVFQGPQAYISPSWYATKAETGKVVPTWNYLVMHAYGRIRFIEDGDWLLAHLTRMTNRFETGRPEPWRVTDAPADFIQGLLKGIVGFELEVTRLAGKWKMSQNRSEADRRGVVEGLATTEGGSAVARLVGGHGV